MNPKTILKSLADLSPDVLEPEQARPEQGDPGPSPTDAKTQRENQPHITVREYRGFARYRHWGLNE